MVVIFWIAAMLHAPFLPSALSDWLGGMFSESEIVDYTGGEAIIPLDLDITPHGLEAEPGGAPETPGGSEPDGVPIQAPPEPTEDAPDAGPELDAGVDASPEEELDAGVPDAGPEEDAGPDEVDGGAKRPGAPAIEKPTEMAGPKTLSDGNYVQVLIAGYRIRNHPLGERAGNLFTTIPEWKSFFAGSDINPITDLDNILLSGPQFRDSKDVVAVIELNVPPQKVHKAIDNLVKRSKGEWLKGTPVPAARAKADRAFRLFALVPQKKLLVVMPLSKKDELGTLKQMKSFKRTSKAGIVVYLAEPHKPFGRVVKIPKSIFWMRLSVVPDADGGATLHLEGKDESPAAAAKHATQLTKDVNAVIDRQIPNLILISRKTFIDRFEFTADGSLVRSTVKVSPGQLSATLTVIETWLRTLNSRKRKKK